MRRQQKNEIQRGESKERRYEKDMRSNTEQREVSTKQRGAGNE